MKICILTPRFPFPQYGGDTLRINEIARYLKSKGHTLVLVSMSDGDDMNINEAQKLYDDIYFVRRNKWGSYWGALTSILKRIPMQCGYYKSKNYATLLNDIIEKEKPDLYIAHLLRMVPYLEKLGLQNKSIIEMTDALSKTYSLSSQAKGGGILKYIYFIERNLIKRYEQHVIKTFPKIVLVSQADVDYLKAMGSQDSESLHVYTNGVDIQENIPTEFDSNKICFIGNMRSMQNQDAALYCANEIFPIIKNSIPHAKFHIVGSLPPSNIKALASDDIIVTGFINDLHGYISDSCVNIAPVRVAAGIQNKVLVAMGCGVPVVMSSLISQGIPSLKDNDNCLICDSAELYANKCIELMTNSKERNKIGVNGYMMVKHYFSWDECLKDYERISS